MDQVKKMLLLQRLIQSYSENSVDCGELLRDEIQLITNDMQMFSNRDLHKQYRNTLREMSAINDEQKLIKAQLYKHTTDLYRKEEVKILQKDYHNFSVRKNDASVAVERQVNQEETLPEFVKEMKNSISNYCDWRWAGVDLNPGNGLYLKSMLASDPLYLLKKFADVTSVKKRFNKFFSEKRLYFYDDLQTLPQNQLGIAININSYEFMPMDPIKENLEQVYKILRPGGHFVFTYNDCNKEKNLSFCVGGYRSYNSEEMMANLVNLKGFDIVTAECYREANSWMVVKKPGDLTSQKLSAPLVKIETTV